LFKQKVRERKVERDNKTWIIKDPEGKLHTTNNLKYFEPTEIVKARIDVLNSNGKTVIRREGEEVPILSSHVIQHFKEYHYK
jgi:hypothetical protein